MSDTLTCSVCGCELDDDFYEAEDEEQCLGICLGFGDVDEVHKLVGGDGQLKLPVLETHLHWYCFARMVEGEAQALVVFGAYVSAFKIFARNPLIKCAVILEQDVAEPYEQ